MKVNSRNFWLASLVAVALFAPSTPAQRSNFPPHPAKAVSGDTSDSQTHGRTKDNAAPAEVVNNCAYQFTTGSGITYLQFCVTDNGNISEFQSPEGVEQLNPQDIGAYEGYGFCDITNDNTVYYDYLFTASNNWNPPIKVSQTATEVKIERSTSDGLWTLTQMVSLTGGPTPFAKISMTLKNNTNKAREVLLIRYANAVPDQPNSSGTYQENYDGTVNSAWGYTPIGSSGHADPYGLMLQIVGNPTPANTPYESEGMANTSSVPNPCNPFATFASPITNNFGSIVFAYEFNVNKEQAVTVNNRYMSF